MIGIYKNRERCPECNSLPIVKTVRPTKYNSYTVRCRNPRHLVMSFNKDCYTKIQAISIWNKTAKEHKRTVIVLPDEEGVTTYKYSDELFDWFYERLKYIKVFENWELINVDLDKTRMDNKDNGCRIWVKNGGYYKYFENEFMIECTEKLPPVIRLSDLVDFFYNNQ